MKKIAILGSTGSIGTQTLEVVRNNPELQVVALAAGKSVEQMEQQIRLRKEITQKIEEMPDETEKTVLRLRYIRWMKWEQIAERMGYSLRNITKIHGKALVHFRL